MPVVTVDRLLLCLVPVLGGPGSVQCRGMVVVAVVSVCSEHGMSGIVLQQLVQTVMGVSYLWLLVLTCSVW
jgi:hypothetical protein